MARGTSRGEDGAPAVGVARQLEGGAVIQQRLRAVAAFGNGHQNLGTPPDFRIRVGPEPGCSRPAQGCRLDGSRLDRVEQGKHTEARREQSGHDEVPHRAGKFLPVIEQTSVATSVRSARSALAAASCTGSGCRGERSRARVGVVPPPGSRPRMPTARARTSVGADSSSASRFDVSSRFWSGGDRVRATARQISSADSTTLDRTRAKQ